MPNAYPNRLTNRAKWHTYAGGLYFVTICALEKQQFFGHIDSYGMNYSEIGKVAYDNMIALPQHHPYLTVNEFVVMPNHIHALFYIDDYKISQPSRSPERLYEMPHNDRSKDYFEELSQTRSFLSTVVGGYKASISRYANANHIEFKWQRLYYDHIVRNEMDWMAIRNYIMMNIANWMNGKFSEAHKLFESEGV